MNPLDPLAPWRRRDPDAAKLYGAIVAQARLPLFYQSLEIPDTLEGRFVMLSVHLFAVLHRLKREGPAARGLAQDLTDRFAADMETVLREIGVGDLSIPKKMRRLAASSAALLHSYEEALTAGEDAIAAALSQALPQDQRPSEAASRRLAHYLIDLVRHVDAQTGCLARARWDFQGRSLAWSWETISMTNDTDLPVLSRPLKVDEIRDGTSGETAATDAELAAIARMLDLVALKRLALSYRLDWAGSGRLRLTGQLQADVTQSCVVTLEPVDAQLEVPVEVEFWPAALVEDLERNAEEAGSQGLLDWPEAVVDGRIDLGPAIYETLATALDPYPKREGASFDWSQGRSEAAGEGKSGPFAALAALKRR